MDRKSIFKLAIFIAGVVLAAFIVRSGYLDELSFENLKARQWELQSWTRMFYTKAVIYFLLLYIVVAALSIPGATILTLAGGAIFGLGPGIFLVSIGATIGGTLCFLGSRFLFRDWVEARFRSRLEAVHAGVAKEGAFYLLTLRLIPVVPFFVINLVFGLTKMSPLVFGAVSLVGMFPAVVVYVNAGTQLAEVQSLSGILSAPVLISLGLLGLFPWMTKIVLEFFKSRKVYAPYMRPSSFDYDILVVGGGAAGLVSAYLGAALKAKVGLIEKHRMGGDCLYTGCVPSKALIRSSQVAHLFRRGAEFGLQTVAPEVDFAKVFSRIQKIITQIEPNDSVERYTGLGVDCMKGVAKIEDPFRVRLGDRVLTTRNIIVATGATPVLPPIPGLTDVPHFTSETLWQLNETPGRVLVLGGGPIGCELAQAFSRLGCATSIIDKGPRLLSKEDPDVSAFVLKTFTGEGIKVTLQSVVARFDKLPSGGGKALLKNGQAIPFDILVVALGRRASVNGFGLENLQLALRLDGTLEVDECLRTRFHNVLACGDVTGPYQFTHAGAYQAGIAVLNALFAPFKHFYADYSSLPWCTYVDPEVARLGLNETDAAAEGVPVDVHRYELEHLDRAVCEGENRGFVKVLTEKDGSKILGVSIVGAHAGEIMAEFALAKRKNLTLNDILNTVHSYPTFAEANKYVAGVWRRKHTPPQALALLTRFHAWRRG